MKIVTFSGLRGGVGTTTLVANVASALVRAGRRVCAVDLDPRNALALHVGASPDELWGHSGSSLFGPHDVASIQARYGAPFPIVPFGRVSTEGLLVAEMRLQTDLKSLADSMDSFVPEDSEIVLLDTPGIHSIWTQAALQFCDLLVGVASPCAGTFAAIPAWRRILEDGGVAESTAVRYVLNAHDPGLALSSDVRRTMRGNLGEEFSPVAVHYDEVVREKLGSQQLVDGVTCQAAQDIANVATWLQETLEQDVMTSRDPHFVRHEQSAARL